MPEASRCTSSFLASTPVTWNTWCVIAGDGRVGLVDGVRDLVVQEPLDELVDAVVQGRGEQHPLATVRRRGQDAGHAGQEAEVGHVVGLVDHGDLDGVAG